MTLHWTESIDGVDWQALGFRRMTTAMAIFQNEPAYLARGYITHE